MWNGREAIEDWPQAGQRRRIERDSILIIERGSLFTFPNYFTIVKLML
jgi:hypothetical protein